MTLLYLAPAWIAGIIFASAVRPPWQLVLALGGLTAPGAVICRDNRVFRLACLSLLAAALGAGRFLLAVPHFDEGSLVAYNDVGWVTMEAVVVGEPDERDAYTNLQVRAERLTLPDGTEREVAGRALVRADRYPRRTCGDRVRITGLLKTPPVYGSFSYREYLARQGVYSYVPRAQIETLGASGPRPPRAYLLALKRRAQAVIAQMLREPEAALLSGILLGVDAGIPEDVMGDFEATGTSHIIVISGFNITIVAGLFAGMAGRVLHRRRALLAAMGAVAVYTVLVGASPAVVRAALMGILYLLARYVGRLSYAPVSLAAAAVGMTAWNPHALWDMGFLLSFAATAGLVLYTEPLEQLVRRVLARFASADRAEGLARLVRDLLLVTVAAQIATTPLLLGSFERFSPVTLLSNTLILPLQPYVMLIGGAATTLGLILQPLGRVVGWVAWLLLSYTIGAVRLTARLPVGSVSMEVVAWAVRGYYVVLAAGTWWLNRPPEKRRELWQRCGEWIRENVEAKLMFVASAVLVALAFLAWRDLPDGRLHVHVLDVGQGDAIFVRTPSGRQVLIDGGPSPSAVLSRLGRRMPFWDRSLDLLVLTHPDLDHITGLVEVLERYRVDAVLYREMGCQAGICERWDELLGGGDVAIYRGEAGLGIALDEGLRMDVLHPGTELLDGEGYNENSLVTRLSYGEVSLLLTGDIEGGAEERLLAAGVPLKSTVLKVAHHGGCGSSTRVFLEAVDPELAVISVGEGNEFGHPCAEVLERLEGVVDGARDREHVYRTDTDGTVELISDGAQVWVRTHGHR